MQCNKDVTKNATRQRGKISKRKEIGVCCWNAGRAAVVQLYRYRYSIYIYMNTVYIYISLQGLTWLPDCPPAALICIFTSSRDWCPAMEKEPVWHANAKGTDRCMDSKPKVNCTLANRLNASIRVQLRALQAGPNCRNILQGMQEWMWSALNISQLQHELPE